jgi:hypothetical protein
VRHPTWLQYQNCHRFLWQLWNQFYGFQITMHILQHVKGNLARLLLNSFVEGKTFGWKHSLRTKGLGWRSESWLWTYVMWMSLNSFTHCKHNTNNIIQILHMMEWSERREGSSVYLCTMEIKIILINRDKTFNVFFQVSQHLVFKRIFKSRSFCKVEDPHITNLKNIFKSYKCRFKVKSNFRNCWFMGWQLYALWNPLIPI